MANQNIDTDRLKTVRKARKITPAKLGKLAGMTERQIAKLETFGAGAATDHQIERLSLALQIPTLTLTGELPMDDTDLSQITPPKSSCGCCP